MFIGAAGPGPVQRPVGPQDGLPVQSAAVRHLHDPRRVRADGVVADRGALHRRHRARRRAAARLRLRRRVFAQGDPRPHPGDRALHRRRLRVADRLAVHAVLPRLDRLARRVDRDRHRRADRLAVPLLAAGIAALSRDPRQGQGSARRARPPRHRRAEGAAHHQRGERHQERSVRHRVQDVPEARDRRHDLLLGVLRRRDRAWAPGCPTS